MVLQRLSYYEELFTVAYLLGRLGKKNSSCGPFGLSVRCWVQSAVGLTALFVTNVCELSKSRHVQVYIQVTASWAGPLAAALVLSVSNRTSFAMERHVRHAYVVIRTGKVLQNTLSIQFDQLPTIT